MINFKTSFTNFQDTRNTGKEITDEMTKELILKIRRELTPDENSKVTISFTNGEIKIVGDKFVCEKAINEIMPRLLPKKVPFIFPK
ncbi:MAG: hypothetical protein M0P12_03255 [Paludibacteraceae bacterium]|nr:hypothetical protein [Paludibacteraceae bacterium]